MKNFLVFVVLVTVCFSISFAANKSGKKDMGLLGLSKEQGEQIKDLRKENQKSNKKINKQLVKEHQRLGKELLKEKPKEATLLKIVDKVKELEGQLVQNRIDNVMGMKKDFN